MRWLWGALSAWLLVAACWLGGAPRSAAILLGVGALALSLVFFRTLKSHIGGFAWFFFVLAAWTALSAVPLPCALTAALAPMVGDVWRSSLAPLAAPAPSFCPLSVAPAATVQSAMNWASYAVLAMAAAALARRSGLRPLLLSVLGVAVFIAVVTLVHALFGLEHLFAVEAWPARGVIGPVSVLVNPNNLAGYMNLGVFAALALLGSRRLPIAPALLVVGGALCLAAAISSGSRGGVLALGFGLLGWTILLVLRRFSARSGPRSEIGRQAPFVLLVVLAGVSIAVLGASPELERELFGDDVSKLEQLGSLPLSLGRVDWSGTGRGGFDSMSARLMHEGGNFTHEYAENFALSWMLEWGPWVGGAALLALLWLLLPGRSGVRGHAQTETTWLGLLVLLLQNLADLGLELPALMGAFAVLGAGLEGSTALRRPTAMDPRPPQRLDVLGLGALMGLLLACVIWTLVSGPTLAAERGRVRAAAERALGSASSAPGRQLAWQAVRRGLERYPAEPYFVLVGGWLALDEGKDAMPWAAEALRRAPASARAHVLVAEVLVRRGAVAQALLHVRHAARADGTLTPSLAARIARLVTDGRQLEAAAPDGVVGARFLLEIAAALPPGVGARTRRHLLMAASARAQGDVRVQIAEGWALLADVRSGQRPCPLEAEAESCPLEPGARTRLLDLAARLRSTPTCEGLRMEAALLVHDGRGSAAVDLLAACPTCQVTEHCAKDRVEIAVDYGDDGERRSALGAFRSGMCDSSLHCAVAEAWLAALFARHSQPELALVHAWRAAELDPSIERYLAAARAARAADRVERVSVALSRARRLGGRDPELEQWTAARRSAGPETLP